MMTNSISQEPTPAFENICINVYRSWKTGKTSFREAIEQLAALAQEALDSNHAANQARAEHLLGNIQGQRGNFNASLTHFERARVLFEQIENWRCIAAMDHNIGETYRNKGEYTHARLLFRKAYDLANAYNLYELKMVAVANEGQMLINMGRCEGAEALLMEAIEIYKTSPETHHPHLDTLAETYAGLAIVHLKKNNVPVAWDYGRRALRTAHKSGETLVLGVAYRALGDVVTAMPDVRTDDLTPWEDADAYYRAALQTLREGRHEGELARTMMAFGQSLARRDKPIAAAQYLQQAMILFSRLEMVADAAKAARAQLEIPVQ
ncbi:MAG: tetratricopeptide repeat protein [Anaerolineae bacterium]|nr:tetratricopeptide repeat protein [Anaerolineae bacterium]